MLDFDNQDGTSHLKTSRPMQSRPVVMIDLEKTDSNDNSVTDTEGTTQYDGLQYQVGKEGETHNEALKSQRRPGTIEEMLPGGNESSHVLAPTSSEILDAIFDIIPRLQATEDMTVLQEHSYATTDSSSVEDNSSQVSIRLYSDDLNSTKCESVDMQHSNVIQHSGVVYSNVNSPGCEIQSSLISSNPSSPIDVPISFQDGDLRSRSKTSSVQEESDRIGSDLAPSIGSAEILLTDIPSIVSSLNENVELTSNGTVHSQNVNSYAIQRPQDFPLPLRTTAVGDSHFETVRFQNVESLRLQGSEEIFSNDSNDGSRLRTRKQSSLQITNQPVYLVKHPNFVVIVQSTVPLNALGSSTNSTSKEKITKKNKVNETAEKREERLRMQRERARLRRSNESKEQRETRRQKDRERQQLKRERDRAKACENGEHVDMRSEIDLSNNEVLSELTHSITSQTITPTSILSIPEEQKNEPNNKDRSVNETRSTGTQLSLPRIRSNLPEVTMDVPCKDISGCDDAKDALDDSKDALDDSKDALGDAKDALDDTKDALDDTKDALDDTKDALDDTKDALDDTKDALDDTKDPLDDMKDALDDTKDVLDDTKDALDDTKNALKLSQKEKNHTYAKKRRAHETPEQRESRLREQRERMRKERVSETDAQRETRRLRDRVRKQVKRSAEEEEIRSKRLTQEREASRRRRSLESAEEKQTRRTKDRDRARKRRASKRVAE